MTFTEKKDFFFRDKKQQYEDKAFKSIYVEIEKIGPNGIKDK